MPNQTGGIVLIRNDPTGLVWFPYLTEDFEQIKIVGCNSKLTVLRSSNRRVSTRYFFRTVFLKCSVPSKFRESRIILLLSFSQINNSNKQQMYTFFNITYYIPQHKVLQTKLSGLFYICIEEQYRKQSATHNSISGR